MIKKVLIANRGVAAVRIARTLRRIGLPYVVVHSEADANLPFVLEAPEAIAIGGTRPSDSYLRGETILAAMQKSGTDAVHPGYGFLSENAGFAKAVTEAGLTFIGPAARHVAELGDKAASRRWMADAGFPVLPASAPLVEGEDHAALAARTGYPLLIKASAGGGGVGMQRVGEPSELEPAIGRARSIAERFFGNGTIYMERWLDQARHVEFQIVGDGKGRALALSHRDCSVQRRHQKVIEEAPIPFIESSSALEMGDRLAKLFGHDGYESLATVEMLLDRSGNFYFLEVNTRLQVEHGVTEAITGLDLVELQIRLADGGRLDQLLPISPVPRGHAIEARIYAEDSVRFLPSPGPLKVFRPPASDSRVSVDLGYAEGNTVTPFYDPMLAIVIAKGDDRSEAIVRLDQALGEFAIEGVKTNIPFLRRMLRSQVFAEGRHHTTLAESFAREMA